MLRKTSVIGADINTIVNTVSNKNIISRYRADGFFLELKEDIIKINGLPLGPIYRSRSKRPRGGKDSAGKNKRRKGKKRRIRVVGDEAAVDSNSIDRDYGGFDRPPPSA